MKVMKSPARTGRLFICRPGHCHHDHSCHGNPELYDATCFETFLKADDVTFNVAKNAKGSGSSSGAGGGDHSAMIMSQSINYNASQGGT